MNKTHPVSGGAIRNEDASVLLIGRVPSAGRCSAVAIHRPSVRQRVGLIPPAGIGPGTGRVHGARSRSRLTARAIGRSVVRFDAPTTSATPSVGAPARRMPNGRAVSSPTPWDTSANGPRGAATFSSTASSWNALSAVRSYPPRTSTTRTAYAMTTAPRTSNYGPSISRRASAQSSRSIATPAPVAPSQEGLDGYRLRCTEHPCTKGPADKHCDTCTCNA